MGHCVKPVKGVKGASLHNKRMMVSLLSRCERVNNGVGAKVKGFKFQVQSSKFKVSGSCCICHPERSLRSEGSVNVSKTIVKHTFTDASFVSMTAA